MPDQEPGSGFTAAEQHRSGTGAMFARPYPDYRYLTVITIGAAQPSLVS